MTNQEARELIPGQTLHTTENALKDGIEKVIYRSLATSGKGVCILEGRVSPKPINVRWLWATREAAVADANDQIRTRIEWMTRELTELHNTPKFE
jgi:hypothetical protein